MDGWSVQAHYYIDYFILHSFPDIDPLNDSFHLDIYFGKFNLYSNTYFAQQVARFVLGLHKEK